MTKAEGEDVAAYLSQINAKLADIASNIDPVRLARLGPEQRRTLLVKYLGYLQALGADTSQLQAALAAVPSGESARERQDRLDRVLDDRLAARLDQLV